MPPSRHTRLTALLAQYDQSIAEADTILSEEPLTDDERARAEYVRRLLVISRQDVERELRAAR